MFKLLLLACCTWTLAASQGQSFDYFYDYVDTPVEAQAPQPVARQPPAASRPRARPAPRQRPQPSRPAVQQDSQQDALRDDSTTPVPIVRDSRRIDTKTGAFVYEYAGADGSEKYEFRYPNGTVIGNYTFINDLGEKETRYYSAGVHDPALVDETTDPNYVDLGNYDLYKHLEEPYIHDDGTPRSGGAAPRRPSQSSRPRAQAPRPVAPRQSAPRPVAPRPPPPPRPVVQSQAPLDFNDETAFFNPPNPSASVFDYEDVAVQQPVPAAPVPVAQPVPVSPQRRRPPQGGRPRAQAPPRGQPHRFDFSSQSADTILDSLISRFN